MRRAVLSIAVAALAVSTACGSPKTATTVVAPPTTSAPTASGATAPSSPAPDAASGSVVSTGPAAPAAGVSTAPPSGPRPSSAPSSPAAVACPAPPARAEPRADRPRYTLHVDVRLSDNAVVGTTDVQFTPDLATDRVIFRLWPNGPRPAGKGGHLDVGTLSMDGQTIPASLTDATTLVGRPEGGIAAGRTVHLSVPWTLTLPGPSSDRISRSGSAVRLGSFFPILPWEPGNGWDTEPPTGAFAEASTAPTADYDLFVTVPAGLTAIASGHYAGGGHWQATATRDVAISVGQFTLAGGSVDVPNHVDVTVGVAAGISESPQAYLNKVTKVLADFSRRYGPYPWPSYTLAITPDLKGGIEYPMHVMQGPGTIGRTTSHEIGHMWFFGLVGDDQGRDPWLDEGLATFAEGRYEGTLNSMKSRSIPADARGRAGAPMTYWESHQSSYYLGVYIQGTQALAALGNPDLVDCALRAYAARYAYGIAHNRDLIDAFTPIFPNVRAVLARYGING